MRRGAVIAAVGVCAGLVCTAAHAQTPASSPRDAEALALLAVAFTPEDSPPAPQRLTAKAFLPGRGVISWDVTGKTPDEAREAEIEAMGAADARAVQRQIDAERAQEAAALRAERAAATGGAGAVRFVVAAPGAPRQPGSALGLRREAAGRAGFAVRNGESLKGQPRMYAFAAVSGQSMGLNLAHGDAGWKNAGLTTDREGFTGQRQAGLAWRKGAVRTALSYVLQKDRTQILGMQSEKDHRLMLTMDLQPQAIAGLFGKTP